METCKKTPFGWNSNNVKKSPFKTLRNAKQAERSFHAKRSIGFTATSSLKAMGRIPRSSGCYLLGPKYGGKTRKTRKNRKY